MQDGRGRTPPPPGPNQPRRPQGPGQPPNGQQRTPRLRIPGWVLWVLLASVAGWYIYLPSFFRLKSAHV